MVAVVILICIVSSILGFLTFKKIQETNKMVNNIAQYTIPAIGTTESK